MKTFLWRVTGVERLLNSYSVDCEPVDEEVKSRCTYALTLPPKHVQGLAVGDVIELKLRVVEKHDGYPLPGADT